MSEQKTENVKNLQLRAKLPAAFRYGAIVLLLLTVLVVLLGFYRASKNPEFRMQGFPTSLSKDVVASISGYERREMNGDVAKYYIKADKAVSFADNHQELENVIAAFEGTESAVLFPSGFAANTKGTLTIAPVAAISAAMMSQCGLVSSLT